MSTPQDAPPSGSLWECSHPAGGEAAITTDLDRSPRNDQRETSIRAARFVAVAPPILFEFLNHLDNHWALVTGYGERVATNDGPGTTIRLRGPVGLRRTVETRMLDSQPPHVVAGTAVVGRTTRAMVRWSIQSMDAGSWVELSAFVHRASFLDRALLTLGGRRWLQRGFETALTRLAGRYSQAR